ncbi:MAG: NUDIX domain-containing protein [Pseudonocardia sp.]
MLLPKVSHRVTSESWLLQARNGADQTLWKIHEERLVDDTRRLDLRIAHVELPDGAHFEQYVLRIPSAAIAVPVDVFWNNVLTIWRHRFIVDRWTWELPGGYVEPGEDPTTCTAREVEDETGWHPQSIRSLGSRIEITYFLEGRSRAVVQKHGVGTTVRQRSSATHPRGTSGTPAPA